MYGNDGHKQRGVKAKDTHFLDMINGVNSDGLEELAWQGSFSSHANKEKAEDRKETKGKEEGKSEKTQTQKRKTQTQKTPDPSSPDPSSVGESKGIKQESNVKRTTKKAMSKAESLPSKKHVIKNNVVIKDEWDSFKHSFDGYNTRDMNIKRYGIYLPEKVYNTYQTFFGRGMSAAMSVELQRFIDRNKDRMKAELSQRSDLL